MRSLYVGVDGGATKAVVRLEDAEGHLLGRMVGAPANIRLSVDKAWVAINDLLSQLLQSCGVSLNDPNYQFHVGMGLAGSEVSKAYEAFLRHPHSFQTLVLSSDAHAACLGAHLGEDGAVIIAGTGVVGYQRFKGKTCKVSGWGFPHDDEGSGAWMGLQACSLTLKALDGRMYPSSLTEKIYAHFDSNREAFISWLNRADSTMFATLAPIVIAESLVPDFRAVSILKEAAIAIELVSKGLIGEHSGSQILPLALLGGVSSFIEPYLSQEVRLRLTPPKETADAGAIWLVREYLENARGIV